MSERDWKRIATLVAMRARLLTTVRLLRMSEELPGTNGLKVAVAQDLLEEVIADIEVELAAKPGVALE